MCALQTLIPVLGDWATSLFNDLNPNNRFALIVILVGCATVALLIPVRYATRVDPIAMLRAE